MNIGLGAICVDVLSCASLITLMKVYPIACLVA